MDKPSVACFLVFMLGMSFWVTGCATLHKQAAQSTEDRLITAGFVMKVPTTPEGEARIKARSNHLGWQRGQETDR